jgi:hypothetical protein
MYLVYGRPTLTKVINRVVTFFPPLWGSCKIYLYRYINDGMYEENAITPQYSNVVEHPS